MAKTKITRILNCIPSKGTERDWQYENAIASNFATASITLPPEVDLRENDWWKINDQGSTGSCVGWAAVDSVMRWHFVKKGMLPPNELLSIRFVWMAAKETDEFNESPSTMIETAGTSLKAALDVARQYGCVLARDLPFESNMLYPGEERDFYALASRFRIVNYFNLIEGASNKIRNWKEWLANGNGPILTRLNVDETWDKAKQNNGLLDVYKPNTVRGGHAIAIVGYTRENRLIIRNSWGEDSFGDKGYAFASEAYAEQAFTDAYGISV